MADMADNLVTLIDEKWSGPAKPDIIEKVIERPDWGRFGNKDMVTIFPLGSGRHIHVTRDYYNVIYSFEIFCHTPTSSDRLKELYEEVIDILYNWYLTGVDKQRVVDQKDVSDKKTGKFKYTIHIEIEAIMVYKGSPVDSGIPGGPPLWPSESSYLIYIEDSTIKAKNGLTGKIDYSGADAATVIQATIDALTYGGKIFIKAGKYGLSAPLQFTNTYKTKTEDMIPPYVLEGEVVAQMQENTAEPKGVILYPLSGFPANQYLVQYNPNCTNVGGLGLPMGTGFKMKDIMLYGKEDLDDSNSVIASGVLLKGTYQAYLENIVIEFATENGIRSLAVGAQGDATYVIHCTAYSCVNYGFVVNNWESYISHSYACACGNNSVNTGGFYIAGGGMIDSCAADDCHGVGYHVENSIIMNCRTFNPSRYDGAVFYGGCVAVGNQFSTKNTPGSRGVVTLASNNLLLVGNKLISDNNAASWILANSASGNLYAFQNEFVGNTTGAKVQNQSSGTIQLKNNVGYITENMGTGTITSGNTSVAPEHGLAATPTRVLITPTTDTGGKRFWVSAKAASTFTITIDSSYGSNIVFDWRAYV